MLLSSTRKLPHGKIKPICLYEEKKNHENYPHVKCLANILAKFSPSKNNHLYSMHANMKSLSLIALKDMAKVKSFLPRTKRQTVIDGTITKCPEISFGRHKNLSRWIKPLFISAIKWNDIVVRLQSLTWIDRINFILQLTGWIVLHTHPNRRTWFG